MLVQAGWLALLANDEKVRAVFMLQVRGCVEPFWVSPSSHVRAIILLVHSGVTYE